MERGAGIPSAETVLRVARALRVPIDRLFRSRPSPIRWIGVALIECPGCSRAVKLKADEEILSCDACGGQWRLALLGA